MSTPQVAAKIIPLMQSGDVATCGVVELEVLFSARSGDDLAITRARRRAAFPRISMSEADFVRAEDVMALLAESGRHRAVNLPDLLIAAVAERSNLTVLHYDADYDLIAQVTGQDVEWVAPRGSL